MWQWSQRPHQAAAYSRPRSKPFLRLQQGAAGAQRARSVASSARLTIGCDALGEMLVKLFYSDGPCAQSGGAWSPTHTSPCSANTHGHLGHIMKVGCRIIHSYSAEVKRNKYECGCCRTAICATENAFRRCCTLPIIHRITRCNLNILIDKMSSRSTFHPLGNSFDCFIS